MIGTLGHPLHRQRGSASRSRRAWLVAAQLCLSIALFMSAAHSAQAAQIPFEQQLLAEARMDADGIVQHRRSVSWYTPSRA